MEVAHMDTALRDERKMKHWASKSPCVKICMNA